MEVQNLLKFKDHLENNPKLLPSSKNIYYKAIKELDNDNPTIEQLNRFIAIKCSKRQYHVKYAIKEYLRFLGREQEYIQLVQAKTKEPIREKVFLTRQQAQSIIERLIHPKFKVIALIQYNTGARASEIIGIDKRRITIEKYPEGNQDRERIRIMIKGKGDKPRYIYLLMSYWKYIKPFYDKCKRYLFIDEEALTYFEYWPRVETMYKKYHNELNSASKAQGLNIGTHDLRRSFATELRKTGEIEEVQQALGHKDINTTIKYLKKNNEQVAESMLSHQKDFLPDF